MVSPGADKEFTLVLDTYVAAGGNHIDLSNVYTGTEMRVGKWLKDKKRDDLIITSKVGLTVGNGQNDTGTQ